MTRLKALQQFGPIRRSGKSPQVSRAVWELGGGQREQCFGEVLGVGVLGDPPADGLAGGLARSRSALEVGGAKLDFKAVAGFVDVDVGVGGRVFGRGGVAELPGDPCQPRLRPLVLRRNRAASAIVVWPVAAGAVYGLEPEEARVASVVQVLAREKFDLATRFETCQRRTRGLPDDGPVLRVADP